MKRRQWQLWAAALFLTGLTSHLRAGRIEAEFGWNDEGPRLSLTVTAEPQPADATSVLSVPVTLYAVNSDEVLWETALDVPLEGEAPWQITLALTEGITERNQRYRIELHHRHAAMAIDYHETLTVERADAALQSYGYRKNGIFPSRTVHFTCSVAGFRGDTERELPITLRVTDDDNNLVLDTLVPVRPARTPTWHALDMTPRGPDEPTGPFRAEVSIESDVYAIHFRTSHSYAWANAHVPVSGMEDGRPAIWFAAHGRPPTVRINERGFFYSPELALAEPATEPRIVYDDSEKQSGTRALRTDYLAGTAAYVWGRRPLPGKPTHMTLWVKGNNTQDRLLVTFEDNINYSLPGWGRRADFSTEAVCTLDFEDWRMFRVPVLGAGHQFDSFAGSSDNIDAPIGIKAFRIKPGERRAADAPEERRSVWIDTIGVETQVRPDERLTMEVRIGDPDGMLNEADSLAIAIGNGWAQALRRGRVLLMARDNAGESVYSTHRDIEEIAPNRIVTLALPLAPLAQLKPRGPVTVDVSFIDTSVPGARVSRQLTLKAPQHGGVFLDFEEPTVFSGYSPGEVTKPAARIVADGAQGAVLELPFEPEAPGSALLHPALPGQVVSITLRVRAVAATAILQPWLIDGGQTGVGNRPYNLFWEEPQVIEPGEDWRELTFHAPPVPAHYSERGRTFLFEPSYPLNLALRAVAQEEGMRGAVYIDQVRIITHLEDDSAIEAQIVYPDDSGMLRPGSELALAVRNYGPEARTGAVKFTLHNSQDRRIAEKEFEFTAGAGEKARLTLIDTLEEGIYRLEAAVFDGLLLNENLAVVDANRVFGETPLDALSDPVGLRLRLGLDREPVYLDWDNSEPAPNAYEFGWFVNQMRNQTAGHRLVPVPVLGFSAEWAGPESSEAIARGQYLRSIANLYQTPTRTIDWELFVREALREFGDQFDEYVFWENPDSDDSPQYIVPERYTELLERVHRWARLYAPQATVTAGGFNYDRVLPYLDRIENVETLPFDRIAVRMNIGELSPEGADLEGFLDELDRTLNLRETGREAQATQCDWGIGEWLSPIEHAAYHARTLMILHSRGTLRHDFGLANSGFSFDGYGVFYRKPYGNNEDLQHLKPYYLPKPAFFAMRHIDEFLQTHRFVRSVDLPDLCRDRNRVFLYRGDDERLRAVAWRAVDNRQQYRLPERWEGLPMEDAFGFDVVYDAVLTLTPLPYLMTFPENETIEEVVHTLRHLADVDAAYPVLLDLPVSEPDAVRRAGYTVEGGQTVEMVSGRIPGRARRREASIRRAVQSERFAFESPAAGMALLSRRWFFEPGGQRLYVRVNDGEEQVWDLRSEREDDPGLRESTFLLRAIVAGRNTVELRYEAPGNSGGYRVEPLPEGTDAIALSRWGMLHARQTRGETLLHQSTVGTPLRIGGTSYETGIGAHAVSLIELPLDEQFGAFEVTVGVDAHTEGRGTVRFRIFVDEREVANSGVLSGLSAPMTLRVEDIETARRLVLSVSDADDGDGNDLANWVDGRLILR